MQLGSGWHPLYEPKGQFNTYLRLSGLIFWQYKVMKHALPQDGLLYAFTTLMDNTRLNSSDLYVWYSDGLISLQQSENNSSKV